MKKELTIMTILIFFYSCSTPEHEKNVAPELYPTEVCALSYYGNGKLLLIDKNHSVDDTIVNTIAIGTSEIDLIIRGYYELKIINSTNVNILLTNSTKEILRYNGNTNGITYQFFNK